MNNMSIHSSVLGLCLQHHLETDESWFENDRIVAEDQSGHSFSITSRTACRPAGTVLFSSTRHRIFCQLRGFCLLLHLQVKVGLGKGQASPF